MARKDTTLVGERTADFPDLVPVRYPDELGRFDSVEHFWGESQGDKYPTYSFSAMYVDDNAPRGSANTIFIYAPGGREKHWKVHSVDSRTGRETFHTHFRGKRLESAGKAIRAAKHQARVD